MTAPAASSLVDLQRLAAAIAKVESDSKDLAVGPNGERGRYQFQEQLWRSITTVFFGAAHDPQTATRVALRHLEWLRQKLRQRLCQPDMFECEQVFELALAWKAGPQAVLHKFATGRQREFAHRVRIRYIEKT